MSSTTTTTTTTDGVSIEYSDTGQVHDAPDLVFVHGITDSRADWAPIIDRLSLEFRCVSLDLRGHGGSGVADDYGAMAMALDVAAVVADAGLVSPVVIGHSLGGVAITAYAAQVPVQAVVNVDQSLRFSDFADALAPLEEALRGSGFNNALAMIFTAMEGDQLPAALSTELAEHRRTARQDVVLGVWDLVFSTPPEQLDTIAAQLGSAITVPYLSLHGLPLARGYEEWLRALMPQVHIEEWPGQGHYLHLCDPDRFAARLRSFVAATTGGAESE